MKKTLIILAILSLVFPYSVFSADNRAIRESAEPSGITHDGRNTLAAFANLAVVSNKTDISFADSGSADTITSVAGDFSVFSAGDTIDIDGSTYNDGLYIIASATSTVLTLASTAEITDESAGATITVQEWPTICVVNTLTYNTNLADSTRNGVPVKTGGFWDFIEDDPGNNRMIVFEVGGTINVTDTSPSYITEDSISIYGQTAPSPGIFIRGAAIAVYNGSTDGVVQHMRFGAYYDSITNPDVNRAFSFGADSTPPDNWAVDHNTLLWSIDVLTGASGTDIYHGHNIYGEALNNSDHSTGAHSAAMQAGRYGVYGSYQGADNILIYKNFFTNNYFRNPELQACENVAMVNNYLYNCGNFNTRITGINDGSLDTGAGIPQVSMDGNYFDAGPDSRSELASSWLRIGDSNTKFDIPAGAAFWFEDNCDDSGCQSDEDDWSAIVEADTVYTLEQLETNFKVAANSDAYWPTGLTSDDPTTLWDDLQVSVGARPVDRISDENRLIAQVDANTGDIIDSVPAWPSLGTPTRNIATGMTADGLPNLPSNPYEDDDSDGRVNILDDWIDLITISVETPYTPPVCTDNDLSLDSNAIGWYFDDEDVFTDSIGEIDLSGGAGGCTAETQYTSADNAKIIGNSTRRMYVGTDAAKDYTNICSVIVELSHEAGDISGKYFCAGKAPSDGGTGIDEGAITKWECVSGNNGWGNTEVTFTIDPLRSVADGESIIFWMATSDMGDGSVDAANYASINYEDDTDQGADLGGLVVYQSDGDLNASDDELHIEIHTQDSTYPDFTEYGSCGLERADFESSDSDELSLAIASAHADAVGKTGKTDFSLYFAGITPESLPTTGNEMTLFYLANCVDITLFNDGGTTKARMKLYDGSDWDATYLHASGISASTRYGILFAWDDATDTGSIDVVDTDGSRVGTRIDSTSHSITLNTPNTGTYYIGSNGSGEYFDGSVEGLYWFSDTISAAEVLLLGTGEYSEPAPTISTISHDAADFDNSDIGSTFTDTMVWGEATYITGVPSYEYESGEVDITCVYSSGSGTTTHLFTCGPLVKNMIIDAITLKSSNLGLNGGSAQDSLDNDVSDLSLPTPSGAVSVKIFSAISASGAGSVGASSGGGGVSN